MTGPRRARSDGVATVEVALALPALALVAWLVVLAGVAGLDQLVVQQAASAAARTMAATSDRDQAHQAATQVAAARQVNVEVRPARPEPGELVEVTVSAARRVGPLSWTVTGRAAALVEPRP